MAGDDERFLREALHQAELAGDAGEVPIGAVLVVGDEILVAAGNRTIGDCDPTAHAEIVALRAGARHAGNHRLTDATLYVSLEPCLMCAGAIVQARLARVVFACADPRAGALGSIYDIANDARLNHRFEVGRVAELEEPARAMLQRFFRERR